MDLTPNAYEVWAKVISKYSEQLINNIRKQNKSYENVVDIGSGLGNISSILYEKLKIKNLFGIDIDPNMIEFANSHKNNSKITFLLQDIAVDWHDLKPELKALEGKVDLIFTSFVMQFIKDKTKAAQNIERLLSPFGHFEGIAFCIKDSLNTNNNGKGVPMIVPTPQQQVSLWVNAFEENYLKLDQVKLFQFEEAVPFREAKTYYQAISVCYKLFMNKDLDSKQEQNLIDQAKDKLMENSYKFIGDMNDTKMVRCESDIYTMRVSKAQ